MAVKEELVKNIRSFIDSSDLLYERKEYTPATVLYFKALFGIIDYVLLTSGRGIPKDHSERFQVLQNFYPRLYVILDKLFPIYRETYTVSLSKQDCDEVRNHVRELVEEFKIPI